MSRALLVACLSSTVSPIGPLMAVWSFRQDAAYYHAIQTWHEHQPISFWAHEIALVLLAAWVIVRA